VTGPRAHPRRISWQGVAIGEGLRRTIGARVAAVTVSTPSGAARAVYGVIDDRAAAAVRDGLDMAGVACIPMSGLTAPPALDRAGVGPGVTVTITDAPGDRPNGRPKHGVCLAPVVSGTSRASGGLNRIFRPCRRAARRYAARREPLGQTRRSACISSKTQFGRIMIRQTLSHLRPAIQRS